VDEHDGGVAPRGIEAGRLDEEGLDLRRLRPLVPHVLGRAEGDVGVDLRLKSPMRSTFLPSIEIRQIECGKSKLMRVSTIVFPSG